MQSRTHRLQNARSLSPCAVSDTELELFFIQARPGSIDPLDATLSVIETDTSTLLPAGERIPRYKCLGKYDVLCISEPGSIAKEQVEQYCVDFEQIRCFAWEVDGTDPLDVIVRAEGKHNWVAICFVKINPMALLQNTLPPILFEHTLVTRLRSKLHEYCDEALVLGGFGWHEIVLLAWDDDLPKLARNVLEVPVYAGSDGKHSFTLVVKTFTVFGLPFDFLRKPEKKRDRRRQWSVLNTANTRDIDMSIFVTRSTLPPVDERDLLPSALRKEVWEIFGSADALIKPDMDAGLGSILESLVGLRENKGEGGLSDAIYSTSTLLGLKSAEFSTGVCVPSGLLDNAVTTLLEAGIGLVQPPEGRPAGNHPDTTTLRELRKQLHVTLRAALMNPLTRDAYLDMVFSLSAFKKAFLPDGSHPLDETSMKTFLDCLSLGYRQRSWGTMNTLWNVGNPAPLFYRGGAQRLLWAAESLPMSLLPDSVEWHGFVVFGLTTDYLRGHLGVLSLPHRVMFQPEEWWGLFHEVGHEYCYGKRSKNHRKDLWLDQVSGIYSLPEEDYPGRERQQLYYASVTWEILSDLFDLRFGFAGNWDLYAQTVTRYLMESALRQDLFGRPKNQAVLGLGSVQRERLEFYLVRLVAAYIFSNEYTSREEVRTEALPDVLRPLFREALGYLPLHGGQDLEPLWVQFEDVLQEHNLIACCERYRLWDLLFSESGQELITEHFGVQAPCRDITPVELAPLKEGHVVLAPVDSSAVVRYLLGLKQGSKTFQQHGLPAKVRIAAILTLWNTYAQELSNRIEALAESS